MLTESKTSLSIQEFVERVLLRDLRRMIYEAKLHYLGFGSIAVGIEFLGACVDDHPFGASRHSAARFERGITDFMTKADSRYEKHHHRLYNYLRCGIAHVMRPTGKVLFTSREERVHDQTHHFQIINDQLLLVCEDFYDDFATSCQALIAQLPTLTSPKLQQPYLVITEFSNPNPVSTRLPQKLGGG